MGVHDGHRERLKERFVEHGLDSFNEVNALELLLFYAIPRKDTNVIAHELLNRFGSLSQVFDAGVRELCEVPGIGENAAVLLKLIPAIIKKSMIEQGEKAPVLNNTKAAAKFLVPRFMFEREEFILMLCLDSQRRLISCTEIGRGVPNAVDTNVRRIAELALKNRASYVMIAHNHPDGVALPSREDDYMTRQTRAALDAIFVPLVDHYIVAGKDVTSYHDSGFFTLFHS